MKRPAQLSLLVALLLVLGVWAAVALPSSAAEPPVAAEAAGLTGDVWVMPAKAVAGFLAERGVSDEHPVRYSSGAVVVGRVTWTPHQGDDQDHFTILLGDKRGGAGVIGRVFGPPGEGISLGNGSMWNETVKAHDWLRGSGPVQVSGGWTEYGQFASVPTTWSGDVWFVGHVLEMGTGLPTPSWSDRPAPVVGVALSTGDRVWWVRRVTAA